MSAFTTTTGREGRRHARPGIRQRCLTVVRGRHHAGSSSPVPPVRNARIARKKTPLHGESTRTGPRRLKQRSRRGSGFAGSLGPRTGPASGGRPRGRRPPSPAGPRGVPQVRQRRRRPPAPSPSRPPGRAPARGGGLGQRDQLGHRRVGLGEGQKPSTGMPRWAFRWEARSPRDNKPAVHYEATAWGAAINEEFHSLLRVSENFPRVIGCRPPWQCRQDCRPQMPEPSACPCATTSPPLTIRLASRSSGLLEGRGRRNSMRSSSRTSTRSSRSPGSKPS